MGKFILLTLFILIALGGFYIYEFKIKRRARNPELNKSASLHGGPFDGRTVMLSRFADRVAFHTQQETGNLVVADENSTVNVGHVKDRWAYYNHAGSGVYMYSGSSDTLELDTEDF